MVITKEEIDSPENDYIEIYLKSNRYNRLIFEVTPKGRLVNLSHKISIDYKLGLEFQAHKGEIPSDLRSKFETSPGGAFKIEEWMYGQ